jgi:hypothetical protein
MLIECFAVVTVSTYSFDGFLYFTCGVSDLVGRRIATGLGGVYCYEVSVLGRGRRRGRDRDRVCMDVMGMLNEVIVYNWFKIFGAFGAYVRKIIVKRTPVTLGTASYDEVHLLLYCDAACHVFEGPLRIMYLEAESCSRMFVFLFRPQIFFLHH